MFVVSEGFHEYLEKFILNSSNRAKKIHPWCKLLNLQKHIYNQQLNIQIQMHYLLN